MTTRRLFLRSSSLTLASMTLPLKQIWAALPAVNNDRVLVVIFQRGAMDGLAAVPPLADSYFNKTLRPSIYVPGNEGALPLDGFFSLHPALAPFVPLWNSGHLSIVHQVGSPSGTRSHFDAQDMMELGTPDNRSTEDGFLNRALGQLPKGTNLRAVALQPNLPRILAGNQNAFALNSLAEFSGAGALLNSGTASGFESMYDSALDTVLKGAGEQTFEAMKVIQKLGPKPPDGKYPKGPLGKHLSEIAQLIKGQVGLQVAVTDIGKWDTHQRQGGAEGQLAKQFSPFSQAIAAFWNDLGAFQDKVCLVTMTEFGRTVKENGNGGTDHGHGSVMFVLGGRVKGKRVITEWKNLSPQNLFEERDLPITTDFRDVWASILKQHLGVTDLSKVFPGFLSKKSLSLFS